MYVYILAVICVSPLIAHSLSLMARPD